MIDIDLKRFNTIAVPAMLSKLSDDSKPEWGMMTAQHMVEHLNQVLNFSYGNTDLSFSVLEEKAQKRRPFLLTPAPLMKEFKAPFLPKDSLADLEYKNIDKAKEILIHTTNEFYAHYDKNPDFSSTHPFFGPLNKQEWEVFHFKHFTHHFNQFGLTD